MLLVLSGYTATGKDTYQDWLLDRNPDLKRAVSATTRPIRPGEVHGKEYYFVSEEEYKELEKQNNILSGRTYYTFQNGEKAVWHYGLLKSEVAEEGLHITVVDHEGAARLRNTLGKENVKVVYFKTYDRELYRRSMARQDDQQEFSRRLADDKIKFIGIEKIMSLTIDSYGTTDMHEQNLYDIERLIRGD